jgi:hypothetical protein
VRLDQRHAMLEGMSSFDEVWKKFVDPTSNQVVVATLVSNQVNGVVGVTKAALVNFTSSDSDDANGQYLASDPGAGVQLFSDRWVGGTPPSGVDEAFVEGQPYARQHADNVGLEIHKSAKTGAYRCTVTLASWGNATFTLEGAFMADVLVAVGDSVGPDAGFGAAEPAVYMLSLKVVPVPGTP